MNLSSNFKFSSLDFLTLSCKVIFSSISFAISAGSAWFSALFSKLCFWNQINAYNKSIKIQLNFNWYCHSYMHDFLYVFTSPVRRLFHWLLQYQRLLKLNIIVMESITKWPCFVTLFAKFKAQTWCVTHWLCINFQFNSCWIAKKVWKTSNTQMETQMHKLITIGFPPIGRALIMIPYITLNRVIFKIENFMRILRVVVGLGILFAFKKLKKVVHVQNEMNGECKNNNKLFPNSILNAQNVLLYQYQSTTIILTKDWIWFSASLFWTLRRLISLSFSATLVRSSCKSLWSLLMVVCNTSDSLGTMFSLSSSELVTTRASKTVTSVFYNKKQNG